MIHRRVPIAHAIGRVSPRPEGMLCYLTRVENSLNSCLSTISYHPGESSPAALNSYASGNQRRPLGLSLLNRETAGDKAQWEGW